MSHLYIGLNSGTSVDAIDAVLVDFKDSIKLLSTYSLPVPSKIRKEALALSKPTDNEINRLGALDREMGELFAEAALSLLAKVNMSKAAVKAIGSHGQNIRHHPHGRHAFTLQVGDPNTIAQLTGITTVGDFRRADIANGGKGAPLVPAFHHAMFHRAGDARAIVNIGGIANVTLLAEKPADIIGFDTGPGNGLMDEWIENQLGKEYDHDGRWASGGVVDSGFLEALLNDPYFSQKGPKSTGKEYFHVQWLNKYLEKKKVSPQNVQTTLVELTAQSIINALQQHHFKGKTVYVCGGGAHNAFLLQRLHALSPYQWLSTASIGIDPDWVESVAFAWMAMRTMNHQPSNLPSVTGAKRAVILGGVYYAN